MEHMGHIGTATVLLIGFIWGLVTACIVVRSSRDR